MCSDEYLLLLARPQEIASVSRLSRDPADSSLWRLGQRFPGNRGNLESALKTRPNLLITMGGGGKSTALIAGKMGLRTLDLPFPSTIQDVANGMTLVAQALGDERRALPWKARLARLQRSAPATRDAIFLGAGGNSVGVQSVEAGWMRLAGLKQRSLPGGRASLEMLATRPPPYCCVRPIAGAKGPSAKPGSNIRWPAPNRQKSSPSTAAPGLALGH
jgi:iron complex transport system substrate-binding protein